MKILFIGPTFYGSTTSMRLNAMQRHFGETAEITVINTQEIIDSHSRIARMLAYRFKTGPIVRALSNITIDESITFDYIWIEKAVLFRSKFIQKLRNITNCLIHFTPDPAFLFHNSRKFNTGINYYDYLVTTKSFELDYYYRIAGSEKTILVNQGYSPETHYITKPFSERKKEILFIGHFENDRGTALQRILDNNIPVSLAGRDWQQFVEKNSGRPNFTFLGEKLYGDVYRETLNNFQYSVGFLADWDKGMHTTRTFEIPACGCILITPTNEEIKSLFTDEEAIHYASLPELLEKIEYYFSNDQSASEMAKKSINRVNGSSYTHFDTIQTVFNHINSKNHKSI